MKSNFWKAAMALLGAGCILATSCLKTQETLKPVFPENKVVKTLSAGESTDIEFEANQDWTLKVQGEGAGNYFGIIDEGIMETSVSGKAGHQTVTVGFSVDEDFDVDRVCAVVLEMGGESREIAQLTKMRGNRKLDIYVALIDDYGYKTSGDGYVYGEVSVPSLTLSTFVGKADYTLPIKVVSNFKWLLNTNSQFVNASVNEANADGEETEVLLTLTTDESLAAGATIDIKFLASEEEGAAAYPYQLTIPAFGQRMEIDNQSTLHFNKEGQHLMPTGSFADQPGICYVLGPKGSAIKALEWNAEKGWYETSFASWVHTELPFDEEKGYLQQATAQITVDANDGAERYADLIVLPVSLASLTVDNLLNSEGDAIKDEYKQYVIDTRLVQDGSKPDFVSFDTSMSEPYCATLEPGAGWMEDQFQTSSVYTLTYSDEYSECVLQFLDGVSSYEIYDFDCNRLSASAIETFWLEVNLIQNNTRGRVYMYPDAYQPSGTEDPESYIVLNDAEGNALAAIQCKYVKNSGGEEGGMFSITQGNGTITPITSGDYFEGICGNFTVTEVYDITVSGRTTIIKSSVPVSGYNIYNMEFSKINDGSLSLEGYSSDEFYVYVDQNITEKTSWIVVLKDVNSVNFGAFIFTYDPETTIGSGPFSFAYPDMVKNATLSRCTGEHLAAVKGEFNGISEDLVYELKYTGEPSMALLNVPGNPQGDASWGNIDDVTGGPIDGYWLTHEMQGGNQMYVNMGETGKVDFFVWIDNPLSWQVIAVLVCTAE
ncbi:MAG: hypothetical protein SOZ21_02145 [Candidatus Cryptobacteroides sp.]|nr:hypothetical protein [Candidatus Cryptobacteroides sp.]